jgi:hypothetical protein
MKQLSDEVETLKNKLLNKQYKKAKSSYQTNTNDDPYNSFTDNNLDGN